MKKIYIIIMLALTVDFAACLSLEYAYLGPKNFIPGNPDPDLTEVYTGRYQRIILAFVWPDKNGNLQYYTGLRTDIISQLQAAKIEVAISIGGEGSSSGLSQLNDPLIMSQFVNGLKNFCGTWDITIVDIDWEFPGAVDHDTLIKLVKELKNIFDEVTITVAYGEYFGQYIPKEATNLADKIQIMTYTQAGIWADRAYHINALSGPDLSVEKSLDYWVKVREIEQQKILLGLSYYGFAYYGIKKLGEPLPPGAQGDFVTNDQIANRWGHLPVQWDSLRQVSYIQVPGDTLIVFDNERSLDLKIAYTKSQNLAGVFYWQIGQGVPQIDTAIDFPSCFIKNYALHQNYPNPFNPMTTIEFTVPAAANVIVKVFNMAGLEMATLANGRYSAGYHKVIWDAKNVPSGIYFYGLRAGDFMKTKKMVLIK